MSGSYWLAKLGNRYRTFSSIKKMKAVVKSWLNGPELGPLPLLLILGAWKAQAGSLYACWCWPHAGSQHQPEETLPPGARGDFPCTFSPCLVFKSGILWWQESFSDASGHLLRTRLSPSTSLHISQQIITVWKLLSVLIALGQVHRPCWRLQVRGTVEKKNLDHIQFNLHDSLTQ